MEFARPERKRSERSRSPCDERRERDYAAISRRQPRSLPHFAENTVLRIFLKGGSNHADILVPQRCRDRRRAGLLSLSSRRRDKTERNKCCSKNLHCDL